MNYFLKWGYWCHIQLIWALDITEVTQCFPYLVRITRSCFSLTRPVNMLVKERKGYANSILNSVQWMWLKALLQLLNRSLWICQQTWVISFVALYFLLCSAQTVIFSWLQSILAGRVFSWASVVCMDPGPANMRGSLFIKTLIFRAENEKLLIYHSKKNLFIEGKGSQIKFQWKSLIKIHKALMVSY